MTLRARVTLAAGFAVLLAVVAVSIVVYVVVRSSLRDQIDASLTQFGGQAEEHRVPVDPLRFSAEPRHLQQLQVVDRDGAVQTMVAGRSLPVTAAVLAIARGERKAVMFDAEVDGESVRIYATSAGPSEALEVGRSLSEAEQTLRHLALTLAVISVAAVGLALVIGQLVAATAAAPVHRVAEAAEAVAQTGDLSHHITVPGGDDLGRLAASFNTMLDALSESLAQQRRLVADASHELRTPLATVRTNVEVLTRADELPPDDRAMLIRDTVAQIGELTRLVGDLVELARGDGQEEPFTVIELDALTRKALEVVRRNHPSVAFRVDAVPSQIRGAHGRVSRAVSNLIDNAAKWTPPGTEVEIAVQAGAITVRDHGPGVDPGDLPHLFDRFYRSPGARTMPGSGLGLAIVKQVADSHGGTITVATAPGGGAQFVFRFPAAHAEARVAELEAPSQVPSPS